MVSRKNMNLGIMSLLFCLGVFLTIGIVGAVSNPNDSSTSNTAQVSSTSDNVPATTANPGIFNYCTWGVHLTTQIGKYSTAPANKIYVIVTLKINNTGEQIYSTNAYYWHLKIGDMYYDPDIETYDSSLNHMTADIGPGGKITTQVVYLVNGNPDLKNMGLYYDGPGSSGIITS